jgi:hypothetical protein
LIHPETSRPPQNAEAHSTDGVKEKQAINNSKLELRLLAVPDLTRIHDIKLNA